MQNFKSNRYNEAVEQIRQAWEAADNAASILRSLRCGDVVESDRGAYRQTLRSVVNHLEEMIEVAQKGVCDDCGGLLITHSEKCDQAALEAAGL